MPDHISVPFEEGFLISANASGAPGCNNRVNSATQYAATDSSEPGVDTVHMFESMGYKTYDSEAIPKTQARVTTGGNDSLIIDDVDPGTNKGSDLK